MRKNASVIAAATILVAVFGISNAPRNSPTGVGSLEAVTKAKNAATSKTARQAQLNDACREILRRLRPFLAQQYTTEEPEALGLAPLCYVGKKQPQGLVHLSVPPSLRFVIATVPNPITTHLPLTFDRMIEVVEQAAQDDHYEYDSSWFPWNEVSKDYPLLADQKLAQDEQGRQQEQPGVVVFRRGLVHPEDGSPYEDGLVVFVVAEQPNRRHRSERIRKCAGLDEFAETAQSRLRP